MANSFVFYKIVEKCLLVFSIILVSGVWGKHKIRRRSPNVQPNPGYCNKFHWGGTLSLHFYVCCNNCDESPNTCDRVTYHTASYKNYCDSCGRDAGNGKLKVSFRCGGCSGQAALKSKCTSWLSKIPGFCWVFANCFQKHCRKRYKSTTDVPENCYNLVCDPGETSQNCPADCCYKQNPAKCTWGSYCNPECCDNPTCCARTGVTTRRLCPFILFLLLVVFIPL